MNKRVVLFTALILVILFSAFHLKQSLQVEETFSNAVLRYGSTGKDVWELQSRLQQLDYYRGPIDGIFGWQTLRAVKDFQYRFGMKVDGVVGPKTKLKLVKATKNWRPTITWEDVQAGRTGNSSPGQRVLTTANRHGFSAEDIRLMAMAVHGEARGEPYEGKVAVAAVILNRLESPNFPNTIPGIIFEPGAFTAVSDGQIWMQPDDSSLRAVHDAINGWDPTGGAVYYFNPATATSKWIWSRPQVKRIGKHIFCL